MARETLLEKAVGSLGQIYTQLHNKGVGRTFVLSVFANNNALPYLPSEGLSWKVEEGVLEGRKFAEDLFLRRSLSVEARSAALRRVGSAVSA
jgi:hypothetical protein